MRKLLTAICLLLSCQLHAAEYAVVVSAASPIENLDADKVKDIFLRHRNFENSVKVVPVNLLGDHMARTLFEMKVLMMERTELNRFWVTNHFQGIKPPATQASLQSMKAFIERVNGAIGYLPLEMVDSSLKVVYEF